MQVANGDRSAQKRSLRQKSTLSSDSGCPIAREPSMRNLMVPEDIVDAIVTVRLPLREEAKPKQIKVQVAA